MKGFWQKHKKLLTWGHLIVAFAHLIMEICFGNFNFPDFNKFSDYFEAVVTAALTGTAIALSIFVIWTEKK